MVISFENELRENYLFYMRNFVRLGLIDERNQDERQKDEDKKTNPFQKTKSRNEKIVERTKRRILKSQTRNNPIKK